MDEILKLARENQIVGLGVGLVFGLYIVGVLTPDEDERELMPVFERSEDAIAWHEARIAALRAIREDDPPVEAVVNQLQSELAEIKQLLAEMRGGVSNE